MKLSSRQWSTTTREDELGDVIRLVRPLLASDPSFQKRFRRDDDADVGAFLPSFRRSGPGSVGADTMVQFLLNL